MESKLYVHYGTDHFDPMKFHQIENRDIEEGYMNYKPKAHTGFWASPVGSDDTWREWCEQSEFNLDNLTRRVLFRLKTPELVYRIASRDDYDRLVEQYGLTSSELYGRYDFIPGRPDPYLTFDFEAMVRDGLKGLELSISDFPQGYDLLYGWDVDSVIIFDPDEIVEVTDVELKNGWDPYLTEKFSSILKEPETIPKMVVHLINDLIFKKKGVTK